LKNFTLEALTIEFQALKKQVIESEKRRERESLTMRYPKIVFRKPEDGKEDMEKGEVRETSEGEEEKVSAEAD
jgi:hypothetical protein